MNRPHLLYLTKDRLAAYAWQQGRLVGTGSFTASEAGLADFTAYLKARRNSEFRILADLRDESHQIEAVPYLRGKDRQAFIARKMERFFFGSPLARAVSLGYEKDERKNERLLLSALTHPADFEPWLACIASEEAALAGVYTLSQLGGALLKKCGKLPERGLLLTRQGDSLRESFIVDGEAWFTRQVPLADDGDPAAAFILEAIRLRQYLVGQSLVGHHEVVPTFILCHPATLDGLEAKTAESDGLAFMPLDNHALAGRMGLTTLPADDASESLFLHFLATRPPRRQFAGGPLRRHCHLLRFRRGLFAVVALISLTTLPLASKGFYDSRILRSEALELSAREKDLAARQQAISAALPRLDVDHATLRRIGTRFADLQASRRQPAEAYRIISRALERSPAIVLESIDWKTAPGPGMPCCEETIAVEGTLAPGLPPRQAQADFGGFIRNLQQDSSLQVAVRRTPFDPASMRGAEGADQSGRQAFAVHIVRKAQP